MAKIVKHTRVDHWANVGPPPKARVLRGLGGQTLVNGVSWGVLSDDKHQELLEANKAV